MIKEVGVSSEDRLIWRGQKQDGGKNMQEASTGNPHGVAFEG